MKKYLILLIALFLVSGCAKEKIAEEPACETPRIMYEGECCLDADNSGICDKDEEASKRAEEITEEETAEVKAEKIPDQCVEMSSWVTCEDIDIAYDKVLGTGKITLQLKNNREGILAIKKFRFPQLPSCNKDLIWSRDETGIPVAGSSKYVIECNSLKDIDILDTKIEMDVNYYERVKGRDPGSQPQYMSEAEQVIRGIIKGSA
ncbi:MAG: hypothetical protein Q8N77_01865 [Nanoarchaeota archaeon]|nr:hypothetical protein [Nanoarchaeota archaeon]